jgi:chromosome partitioning protein
MRPEIIAIANQKGGVGKTTIAYQVGITLSLKYKYRVLLVDLDPQGNLSTRVIKNNTKLECSLSRDLFNKEDVQIVPTKIDSLGLSIIPCEMNDSKLSAVESKTSSSELDCLKKHMAEIEGHYDFILIDTAPSMGKKLIATLCYATSVISPIKLSSLSLSGLRGHFDIMKSIRRNSNKDLKLLGVVANLYNNRRSKDSIIYAQLQDQLGDLMFNTRLSDRLPIEESMDKGVPIWDLKMSHKESALIEVDNLVSEVLTKVGSQPLQEAV